jgi:cytochrome b561
MQLADTGDRYGWISIVLHWTSAAAVLVVWFMGSSINAGDTSTYLGSLRLHVSLAMIAYALLWIRIYWRLREGHPGPTDEQQGVFFVVGKVVHYVLLGALAVMLLSGPLLLWSKGNPLYLFSWEGPVPEAASPRAYAVLRPIHAGGGAVTITGIILHLAGVFKHAAFNRDGTLDKMLRAPARDKDTVLDHGKASR